MTGTSATNNHHPWLRNAWEARQAISEALVALPENYSRSKTVAVNEYHELAQTYLFEYYSVFEPKKDQFGANLDIEDASEGDLQSSLWHEPLMEVEIPVSGTVKLDDDADLIKDGTPPGEVLSAIRQDMPLRRHTLCIGSLDYLYRSQNTFEVEVKGWVRHQGPESRVIRETYHLPISGIHAVRSQLDNCLEKAGWLPDVDTSEDASADYSDILENGET